MSQELAATRIFLRPIASPFALGFVGLAGATVSVAGLELGWIPQSQRHQVGLIVLVFAPLLQTIACVFGFLGRDAVAATGMGLLAGTWGAIALVLLTTPPGATSDALGLFLFAAVAAYLVSALTAAVGKLVPAVVMLTTAVRLCLTAVYEVTGSTGWEHAAGWAGLVLAFFAVYAAASLELEGVLGRPALPTLRHGQGLEALDGDLATQVADVADEAGIRKTL